MKAINFIESASTKIYEDYIRRIKRTTSKLTKEDRNEVLMEFNSHIYEGLQKENEGTEIDNLLHVIQSLGDPEDVLKPLIAEKVLAQATRTFNPIHIFKALVLNLANGISYIIFSILYLLLFGFGFMIVAKILNPKEVGLFFKEGQFMLLGMMDELPVDGTITEVLGGWFIAVMLFSAAVLYVLITLLLRAKQRMK